IARPAEASAWASDSADRLTHSAAGRQLREGIASVSARRYLSHTHRVTEIHGRRRSSAQKRFGARMSIGARIMRMKLVFAVAALAPLVCSAAAQGVSTPNASVQNAGQWSPVGLWQAVDSDTKQPTGWFLIDDHNGVFDGIIAKMFLKPGEDPNTT